jgi:site-specific recombinase XerC
LQAYQKPKRKCPFCQKFTEKLRRHLSLIHKSEEEVKDALDLIRNGKKIEGDAIFEELKKRGIMQYNLVEIKTEVLKLQRAKYNNKNGDSEVVWCDSWKGFLSKKF